MFEQFLSLAGLGLSAADVGLRAYRAISDIKTGREQTSALLNQLQRLDAKVERLSDTILYVPDAHVIRERQPSTPKRTAELADVRQALEPVQRVVDAQIVSSELITVPDKMQKVFVANPWSVLDDIQPVNVARRPSDPNKAPILFNYKNTHFVGWTKIGALGSLFDVDYDYDSKLWTTRYRPGEASGQTGGDDAANERGVGLHNKGLMEEAIFYYRKAIELNPEHHQAHSNLAMALTAIGDKDEAISQFERALAIAPDYGHALRNFGELLVNSGQVKVGISHLQKAVLLDPNDEFSHFHLGDYSKVIELNPKNAIAHLLLGVRQSSEYWDPKSRRVAVRHLLTAIELGLSVADQAQAHLNLALAYANSYIYDEVDGAFEKAETHAAEGRAKLWEAPELKGGESQEALVHQVKTS